MCELLAMSASFQTGLKESLELFQPRGGASRPHADGWGIATFDNGRAIVLKEPEPATSSTLFGWIRSLDFTGDVFLAHIRKANPSGIGRLYENTHPFQRDLLGHSWVFAHNGKLTGVQRERLVHCQPRGATDSEHAFCMILDALHDAFGHREGLFNKDEFLGVLGAVTSRINACGEFNYVLSNGELIAAHAHTYLHTLQRQCAGQGEGEKALLIATHPLTQHEDWTCLLPNTLSIFSKGEMIGQGMTFGAAPPEAWENQQRLGGEPYH